MTRRILGFVCERALPLARLVNAEGRLREAPEARLVALPCAGILKPAQVAQAFREGAEGVFVCGCGLGDCYYRTGNLLTRERLEGRRRPSLPEEVDRRRLGLLFLSTKDPARFLEAYRAWRRELEAALQEG